MSGLREALEAFTYASDDGTEWEHANPGCQGEPDCAACWAETIRRALADHPAEPAPVIPVDTVRAQRADYLNRATWARNHGQAEAASLWVSAADLLQYLLPEEPTS